MAGKRRARWPGLCPRNCGSGEAEERGKGQSHRRASNQSARNGPFVLKIRNRNCRRIFFFLGHVPKTLMFKCVRAPPASLKTLPHPDKCLWWIRGSEKSRNSFWHPHLHWHPQNEAVVTWAGNPNPRWLKEFKILESEEILEQRLNFPAECGMGAHGGLQSVVGKQGRVCSFSCRLKRCILTFICLPQGLAWPLSGFGGVLKRVSKNIPWRWLLLQPIIL